MKKIFAIMLKDMRIRFSSAAEWLFFIILPVVFTFLLAGGTGATSDNRIRLVVVDLAKTPLSGELVTALEGSEAVRPELESLAEAEEGFDARRVNVVLIIPAGFSQEALETGDLLLEMRQQPNNLNALAAERAIRAIASRIGQAVEIARSSVAEAETVQPFGSEAERLAYFEASLNQARILLEDSPDRITELQASTEDPVEYDPRANSSAGQLITWVFIPLIGLSELFTIERLRGTLRRMLTTPTSKGLYLFGTIFGNVLTALAQMTLLIGFGILVMQLDWGRDPGGLAVMMVASCLAAAALGTMLGTFVKSEGQAQGISILLGMVMALMGGCWYPLELFPEVVRSMVRVLPTTWAMDGMLDLVLRGQGLSAILPEAGVLLGFAAVFFVIGVWRFKYE